jgi:C-terminal processing protease CtpA/Prc
VVIVDLRDKDGGSFGFGLQLLKGWIDEVRMAPWEGFGKQLTSSCLYAPLRWNGQMALSPKMLPDQRLFLQSILDQMARSYPPDCPRTVETTAPRRKYSEHHFAPKPGSLRIVALVNSGCGSDCELLAAEMASLPETIVAGTNTFGVGQFIQPGYSVLPHTGLRYRIALRSSNFYGDRRSFDGFGLDVDIVLPDVDTLGTDQLRRLAKLIAHL